MESLCVHNHEKILENISGRTFDVIVIGGGITGAGIALDASLRGLSTLLIEKKDYAWGTSSKSTKLIHGGLRYLKQFEFGLVREVGLERAIVYNNARHIVRPEHMLLPIYKGGNLNKWSTSAALFVYDFLADVPKEERRKMLSREEVLKLENDLKSEGLKGGGLYFEYRTDDARLTTEVIKSSSASGAICLNYSSFEKFIYNNKLISGIEFKYIPSNSIITVNAKQVVNATGPWVDALRKTDDSLKEKRLQLTKGIHLVFRGEKFPLDHAVYFDAPDGRMVFAIPREGKTYVGTTDTVYSKNIDTPRTDISDVKYILDCISHTFPSIKLKSTDVESSWAGLRPLIHEDGKSPSELSRKDEIFESDSGLISIAGGKLTGYRKMAERVVDLIMNRFEVSNKLEFRPSKTENFILSGGNFVSEPAIDEFLKAKIKSAMKLKIDEDLVRLWVYRYGTNTDEILETCFNFKDNYSSPAELALFSELKYTIDNESVRTLSDFFIRRTGMAYFHIDLVHKLKEQAAEILSSLIPFSDIEDQLEELNDSLKGLTDFRD
jgi:glycerol-3-phosphate dehydrogenase